MAHLWVRGAFGWVAKPLRGRHVTIQRIPAYARANPQLSWDRSEMDRLALHFSRGRDTRSWHLWTGDLSVLVNRAHFWHCCELFDRDVIDVPVEGVLIFAADTPPLVERFPGPVEPSTCTCARCGSAMEGNARAVRCPACEAWHHQSRKERCWTAQPGCANCGYPTDLRAGFPWRPGRV